MYVRRRYRHRFNTSMYYSRNPREVLHPYTGSSKITIESKDLEKVSEYLKSNGYTVVPPWGPDPPPEPPVPPIFTPLFITSIDALYGNDETGLPTVPPPSEPYSSHLVFRAGPYQPVSKLSYYYIYIDVNPENYYIITVHYVGSTSGNPPQAHAGQYVASVYSSPSSSSYFYMVFSSTDGYLFYLPIIDPVSRSPSGTSDPDLRFILSKENFHVVTSEIIK